MNLIIKLYRYIFGGTSYKISKLLLERGADPNAQDNEGDTSLHIVTRRKHKILIRLLLEYGADPHIENNNGISPFMIASNNGETDIQNILTNHMKGKENENHHQP